MLFSEYEGKSEVDQRHQADPDKASLDSPTLDFQEVLLVFVSVQEGNKASFCTNKQHLKRKKLKILNFRSPIFQNLLTSCFH